MLPCLKSSHEDYFNISTDIQITSQVFFQRPVKGVMAETLEELLDLSTGQSR